MKYRFIKRLLVRAGRYCPLVVIRFLNSAINYLGTGHWFKARGIEIGNSVPTRYQLFDLVVSKIAQDRVLYLEFGVYEGTTMRYWSKLLRNPSSQLHGFDSFTGLPEGWNLRSKHAFSTGGQIPLIDDPRVKFFKGWFSDTLKDYTLPDNEQLLFVNIDADLYASAKTVLEFLSDRLRVGSYIYFDEFCDRANELKAFDEFIKDTKMEFRAVCATEALEHVVFQRVR